MRLLATVLVAFVLALAAGSTGGADENVVPPIVRHAGVEFEESTRGVIAMRRHFATDIHAGPVRHSEASESALIINSDAYVKIKYYRIADDGKAFSDQKLADRESQTNRDWGAGKVFFKEPYDPRYDQDYRFSAVVACECPAATESVDFKSAVRDAQHGDGSMTIETASGRVLKLTYVPNVLPPHANSGKVTETGGEAAPNLWYVTRIDESFSGRAFLLTGNAVFVGTFDHFHRYANVAEGVAAVDGGEL